MLVSKLAINGGREAELGVGGGRRAKSLEIAKRVFPPHNPLQSHKTAKGILGKAWRFQAENLEKFGKKLGKICCPETRYTA